MRNRGMKNPFSEKVRRLFLDGEVKCWECGRTFGEWGGIEPHHILGRISNSAYNLAPLCTKCHDRFKSLSHEKKEQKRREYLHKTFRYLENLRYTNSKKDDDFIEKNIRYYFYGN